VCTLVFSFKDLQIQIVCILKLKGIKGNKIRKFYWNKKIFNVKKFGVATKYN